MAKIKSRITSKPPKMIKAPYIGSYVEGQAKMGKVYNTSLRKFYGWDNIKPEWNSKV